MASPARALEESGSGFDPSLASCQQPCVLGQAAEPLCALVPRKRVKWSSTHLTYKGLVKSQSVISRPPLGTALGPRRAWKTLAAVMQMRTTHVAAGGTGPTQPRFGKCWLHGRLVREVSVPRLLRPGRESLGLPGVTWLGRVCPPQEGTCLNERVTAGEVYSPGEAQAAPSGVSWPGSQVFERPQASSACPSVKQEELPQPSLPQPV